MDRKKLRWLLIGEFSVKRLIKAIVFVYVSVLVFAYFYSDRMIFPPRGSTYKDGPEILKIEVEDQTYISALYLLEANAKFTILYSHGNAEDIGDVRPILETFRNKGFSVFAYDYRGYGTSDGTPSEKNAYQDIEVAYEYLVGQLKVPSNRIIVMGRSVGGGPSVHLACREQIAGLILEGSFVTAFRVMTRIPLTPFDKFRNINKIKKIKCPVLVIHGKDDRTVPIWHGEKLFEEANEPKFNLWVEGAGHNDDIIGIAGARYWEVIEELTRVLPKRIP